VELGRLTADLARESKGKRDLGDKVVRLMEEKAAADEQMLVLTAKAQRAAKPSGAAVDGQQQQGSGALSFFPTPQPAAPSTASTSPSSTPPAGAGAASAGAGAGGGGGGSSSGGEAFKKLIASLTEENKDLKDKIDQYKVTIKDLGRRIGELEQQLAAAAAAAAAAAGGGGAAPPPAPAAAALPGNPFAKPSPGAPRGNPF